MNNIQIETFLRHTALLLSESSSPRLDVELLLAHVLDKPRSWLFIHSQDFLTEKDVANFYKLLALRQKGMPIAYILGYKTFWSFNLKVNEHTLIPRPETELLVECILQIYADKKDFYVLELGTGTGAIALALAAERKLWKVHATDISKQALLVAQENAVNLSIPNIQFFQSDWFASLKRFQYDLIVSNPPYIAKNDPYLVDLQFEPQSALVSSSNGLADIKKIISQARLYLKEGGSLWLEHGYDQGEAVFNLFEKFGYHSVETKKDFSGHCRLTMGFNEV